MTEKLKIRLSELEKLPQDDLLALASHVQKIRAGQRRKTQERYLDKVHEFQLAFHKNQKRIRCFLGGNRCLTGQTLVETASGPKAIRDIVPGELVWSWDQLLEQFQLQPSSAPFPKGKETIYRVFHERGEFEASAQHLVLCDDGEYLPVGSLRPGVHKLASYQPSQAPAVPPPTILEFCQTASLADVVHCLQKPSSCAAYCEACIRQHGRQPLEVEDVGQALLPQQNDALKSSHTYGLERCTCHKGGQEESLQEHIRPDLLCALRSIEDLARSVLARSLSVSEVQAVVEPFERALGAPLKELLSLLMFYGHRTKAEPVCKSPSQADPSGATVFLSLVKSIEIVGSEVVWDVAVAKNDNFLAEGAIHHNSGKSTAGTNEFIWLNLGTHPYRACKTPIKSAIIAQDYENHVKNIIEKKIEEWAPEGSITKIEKTQTGAWKKIHWKSGSVTDIYSHDQHKKVFEGADFDAVWFDEPPPRHIFVAIFRGLTDRGGIAFITATPIVEPWLFQHYKESEQNADSLWWFQYVPTTANAKNLGEGDEAVGLKRIEEFASTLDAEERVARLEGRFMVMEGMVFKAWSRRIHVIKPFDVPKNWPIIESIDPHPRKPAGVTWVALAPNGAKILLQSGYLEGDMYELGHEILRWREKLPIQESGRPRLIRTLIDNASNAPLTGKSQTNQLKDRVSCREEIENVIGPRGAGGPRIECPPKSVSGKIDALRSWLTVRPRGPEGAQRNRADLYVFDTPDNEDFIEEIESYVWAKFKNREQGDYKDRPVKKHDDILDSLMQIALTLKEMPQEPPRPMRTVNSLVSYGAGRA